MEAFPALAGKAFDAQASGPHTGFLAAALHERKYVMCIVEHNYRRA
jgi:hypothetical protein